MVLRKRTRNIFMPKAQCGFVKDFSVLSVSIEKKGAGGRKGGGGPKKKPVSRLAVGSLSIGCGEDEKGDDGY
jgi:hypothetical protein